MIVDWHADYKPGSYPVTEEQRKAAAKRYGMLPEEYKPYPDDGECNDCSRTNRNRISNKYYQTSISASSKTNL